MSLNWDITKCDECVKNEEHWPVTNALIWATMSVGIGEIKESTIDEFCIRLAMWQQIFSPLMCCTDEEGNRQPRPLVYADVVLRMGLSTNVSTESKAAWKNRMMANLRREAERSVRQARKAAEQPA